LANVANLAKRINILKKEETVTDEVPANFGEYFPNLVWVLRDFTLDTKNLTPK